MFYESVGVLRYYTEPVLKLVVDVDQEVSEYYRSLMPKSIDKNPQKYAAHISVVRHEVPPRMDLWGLHEGKDVRFTYENVVHEGSVYFWLNAFSSDLEKVRLELGLPVTSMYTLPPEGFVKCFHITIGNKKF